MDSKGRSGAVPPEGPRPSSITLRGRLNASRALGKTGAMNLRRPGLGNRPAASADRVRKGEEGFEEDEEDGSNLHDGAALSRQEKENGITNRGRAALIAADSKGTQDGAHAPVQPQVRFQASRVSNGAGSLAQASTALRPAAPTAAAAAAAATDIREGALNPTDTRGTLDANAAGFNAEKFEQVARELMSGALEYCYVAADPADPYILRVIDKPKHSKSETHHEYMTLSRNGVVRSSDGDAECQSFKEFAREHQAYHRVMELAFFKDYRKCKSFLIWKSTVRRDKFNRAAAALAINLISLDPYMKSMYDNIIATAQRIRHRPLLELPRGAVYDISEFTELQAAFQKAAREQNLADVAATVECIRVQGRANLQMALFPERSRGLGWKDKLNVGKSSKALDAMIPLASALTVTGDDALSFSDRAAIRTFCRRLVSLIRMGDFVLRDAFYDAAETALRCLRDSFLKTREAHKTEEPGSGAFAITLSVSPPLPEAATRLSGRHTGGSGSAPSHEHVYSELVLSPSPDEVTSQLEAFIDATMTLGSFTTSLFASPALGDLISPLDFDHTAAVLEDCVFLDPGNSMHELKEECETIVEEDCDAVEEACNVYDVFCEEMNANAKYGNGICVSALVSVPPSELNNVLLRLKEEGTRCAALPKYLFVGVMRCGLADVKTRSSRQVDLCRRGLSMNIPEAFLQLAEATINRCYHFRKIFSEKAPTLDSFLGVLVEYHRACAEHDELEQCYKRDTALMSVIEAHQLPVTDSVGAKYKGLRNMWRGYLDAKQRFTDGLESAIKEHKVALDKIALNLRPRVSDAHKRVHAKFLEHADSDHSKAIADLSNIVADLRELHAVGADVEEKQLAMGVSVYDNAEVNALMETACSNQHLWMVVRTLRSTKDQLFASLWHEVRCDELMCALYRMQRTLRQSVKAPNPAVLSWASGTISDLTELVDTIRRLQSPVLMARHHDELVALVQRNVYGDDDYVVRELVEAGLCEATVIAGVGRIVECAHREHCLQGLCDRSQTELSHLLLQAGVESEKRYPYVCNFPSILHTLEELSETMAAALVSQHVAPHRRVAERELKRVDQWLRWTRRLASMQTRYMRYRMVFTTARLSKSFSANQSDFASVDELWKVVIHRAKDEVRQNLSDVLNVERFAELLAGAEAAAGRLDTSLTTHTNELRRKWPRLYLLDDEALLHALATADLWVVFAKCGRQLLPAVTDVHFDTIDRSTTVAAQSGGEIVTFASPISASRSAFVDWMRMLETALDEQVTNDMQEFRRGKTKVVEDAINPKASDQARLAALQVQLWNEFDQTTAKTSGARREKVVDLVHKCASLAAGLQPGSVPLMAMRNLILALGHHRDLLDMAFFRTDRPTDDESCLNNASLVALALRKQWSAVDPSVLVVAQGHLRLNYGFHYQGMGPRLAITPLTQKYFFAVAQAMQDLSVPVLCGRPGSGRASLLKELAYETGREVLEYDCAAALATEDVMRRLQVSVGCAVWVSFTNMCSLRSRPGRHGYGKSMLDELTEAVWAIHSEMLSGAEKITVDGVSLLTNTNKEKKDIGAGCVITLHMVSNGPPQPHMYLPSLPDRGVDAEIARRFRPLFLWSPCRTSMFQLLVMSCAPHFTTSIVEEIVGRLEAFAIHMERTEPQIGPIVDRLLVNAIHKHGYKFSALPSEAVVKTIVLALACQCRRSVLDPGRTLVGSAFVPHNHTDTAHDEDDVLLPDSQLRLLLNVFADAQLDQKELDAAGMGMDVQRPSSMSPSQHALGTAVHNSDCGAVVVGTHYSGKSTVIRECIGHLSTGGAKVYGIAERFGTEKRYTEHSRVISAAVLDMIPLRAFPDMLHVLLGRLVGGVPNGHTVLAHVDAPSSQSLVHLIRFAHSRGQALGNSVRLLIECAELSHLTPRDVTEMHVVSLGCAHDIRPTPQSVTERWVRRLTGGDRPLLRRPVLEAAVAGILVPLASLVGIQDPSADGSWLVDHVFQLVEALGDVAVREFEQVMPMGETKTVPTDGTALKDAGSEQDQSNEEEKIGLAKDTSSSGPSGRSDPSHQWDRPSSSSGWIDDLSVGRMVAFAAHLIFSSESEARTVSGVGLSPSTHSSPSSFNARVRQLMESNSNTKFHLNCAPGTFPPNGCLGDYYLRIDTSGVAETVYNWCLWSSGAERSVDDVEDVPLYQMPAHMISSPRHPTVRDSVLSPHIMAPGLWDPSSIIFPTPALATVWSLRRLALASQCSRGLHFNLSGDSYSGRSTILKFLATSAAGVSNAAAPLPQDDHWSLYLSSTSVAQDPSLRGRLLEGCARAQAALLPTAVSTATALKGCIYVDDISLEAPVRGEQEAESELLRYATHYGSLWNKDMVDNDSLGGASFFVVTRLLGGGVREPNFSSAAARARSLRTLRSCINVAIKSDLRYVHISQFCTMYHHMNIDVVLDTFEIYSATLERYLGITAAQPTAEDLDEFMYLAHARAPLATVSFLMHMLAFNTDTGKPMMPADAIKAAATTLCDYRSLYAGARAVLDPCVDHCSKELSKTFRYPMFGDIFNRQVKQRGSERIAPRKSSVLVKSLAAGSDGDAGSGAGPAGSPKKGSAATVVTQGAGRSLAQVRSEVLSVLETGVGMGYSGWLLSSSASEHQVGMAVCSDISQGFRINNTTLDTLQGASMELWKCVKLIQEGMRFPQWTALIEGGGSSLDHETAIDGACASAKWRVRRSTFTVGTSLRQRPPDTMAAYVDVLNDLTRGLAVDLRGYIEAEREFKEAQRVEADRRKAEAETNAAQRALLAAQGEDSGEDEGSGVKLAYAPVLQHLIVTTDPRLEENNGVHKSAFMEMWAAVEAACDAATVAHLAGVHDPEIIARWSALQNHRVITILAAGSSQAALSALAESHLVRHVHVWRLPSPTLALDKLRIAPPDALCARAFVRACSRFTNEAWAALDDSAASDVQDFMSSPAYRTGTLQQLVRLSRVVAGARHPHRPSGTHLGAVATRTVLSAVESAVGSILPSDTPTPPTPDGKAGGQGVAKGGKDSEPPATPPTPPSPVATGDAGAGERSNGGGASDPTPETPAPMGNTVRVHSSITSPVALYSDVIRAVLDTRYLQGMSTALWQNPEERADLLSAAHSREGLARALFGQISEAAQRELQASMQEAVCMLEDPSATEEDAISGPQAVVRRATALAQTIASAPVDPIETVKSLLLAPGAVVARGLGICRAATTSMQELISWVEAVSAMGQGENDDDFRADVVGEGSPVNRDGCLDDNNVSDGSGVRVDPDWDPVNPEELVLTSTSHVGASDGDASSRRLLHRARVFLGELALSLLLSGTVLIADSSGILGALLCPPRTARNKREHVFGLLPGVRVSEASLPDVSHLSGAEGAQCTQGNLHSVLEVRLFGDDRVEAVQGDEYSTLLVTSIASELPAALLHMSLVAGSGAGTELGADVGVNVVLNGPCPIDAVSYEAPIRFMQELGPACSLHTLAALLHRALDDCVGRIALEPESLDSPPEVLLVALEAAAHVLLSPHQLVMAAMNGRMLAVTDSLMEDFLDRANEGDAIELRNLVSASKVTAMDLVTATLAHLKVLRRAEGLLLEDPAPLFKMVEALDLEDADIANGEIPSPARLRDQKPRSGSILAAVKGGDVGVPGTSVLQGVFAFAYHLHCRGQVSVALPPGSGRGLTGLQFDALSDWVRFGDSVTMQPLVPTREGWLGWGQFLLTALMKPRLLLRLLTPMQDPRSPVEVRQPGRDDFIGIMCATVTHTAHMWASEPRALVPGVAGLPAGAFPSSPGGRSITAESFVASASQAVLGIIGDDNTGLTLVPSHASILNLGSSGSHATFSPNKSRKMSVSQSIIHVHNHHFETLGPLLVNRFLWLTVMSHAALSMHFRSIRVHGQHAIHTIVKHFASSLDSVRSRHLDLTSQYVDTFMAQPLKDAVVSVYTQLVDSPAATVKIVGVIGSYFCPGWHDLNETYHIQQAVALPEEFNDDAALALAQQLKDCTLYGKESNLLLEGEEDEDEADDDGDAPQGTWVTDVTLAGCASGESNERAREELEDILSELRLTRAWEPGISERMFPALSTLGAASFMLVDEVIRQVSAKMLADLPEEISLHEHAEYADVVAHKRVSTSLSAVGPPEQNRRTSGAGRAPPRRVSMLSSATAGPPSPGAGTGSPSQRAPPKKHIDSVKFFKESGLILSDTRSVEPLWAAAVLEVHAFNQCLRQWRHGIGSHAASAAALGDEDAARTLLRGEVATQWLKLDVQEYDNQEGNSTLFGHDREHVDNSGMTVSWSEALGLLHKRRRQVSSWILRGTPSALRMSLLADPRGLIHACKERYAAIVGTKSSNVESVVSVVETEDLTPELCSGIVNDAYGSAIIISATGVHNGLLSRATRPQPTSKKEEVYDINTAPASAMSRVEQMVHLKVRFKEIRVTEIEGKVVVREPPPPLPEGVSAVKLPVYATTWDDTVNALVRRQRETNSFGTDSEAPVDASIVGRYAPLLGIALETESDPADLEMNGTCLLAL